MKYANIFITFITIVCYNVNKICFIFKIVRMEAEYEKFL